jgi:hypothetical protein
MEKETLKNLLSKLNCDDPFEQWVINKIDRVLNNRSYSDELEDFLENEDENELLFGLRENYEELQPDPEEED